MVIFSSNLNRISYITKGGVETTFITLCGLTSILYAAYTWCHIILKTFTSRKFTSCWFPARLFKTLILDFNISSSQVNNIVVTKALERYPIFQAKICERVTNPACLVHNRTSIISRYPSAEGTGRKGAFELHKTYGSQLYRT